MVIGGRAILAGEMSNTLIQLGDGLLVKIYRQISPAAEAEVEALTEAAQGLGCTLPDPFMTLSFLALPVIPSLKLTDKGLVDVNRFDLVPLFGD